MKTLRLLVDWSRLSSRRQVIRAKGARHIARTARWDWEEVCVRLPFVGMNGKKFLVRILLPTSGLETQG